MQELYYNGKLILGVDHGYGNMKTAHRVFAASVEKEVQLGARVLEYKGKEYGIGGGHKEFQVQKINDEDYWILTLAAVAEELKFRGKNEAVIHLAAGVPLFWVKEQKESFREYLLCEKDARFKYNGESYHVVIADASIYPQGYAAFINYDGDIRGNTVLADESPIRHSRVFCTRWNGLNKASGLMDAIDDEEYSGGLVNLLQDSMNFVSRNTKKAWRKTGNGRIEMPDYPDTAVLEGIVNALIHRDYLELGSEVHIDMFDDRLEIYSPGGMPDGSKVQNLDLRNVSSKRRNPIIADILNRLNYMDRRGSGFKKILDSYEFQEHYTEDMKPEFKSGNSDFWLIFKNLNYGAKDIEDALLVEITDKERHYLNQDG